MDAPGASGCASVIVPAASVVHAPSLVSAVVLTTKEVNSSAAAGGV